MAVGLLHVSVLEASDLAPSPRNPSSALDQLISPSSLSSTMMSAMHRTTGGNGTIGIYGNRATDRRNSSKNTHADSQHGSLDIAIHLVLQLGKALWRTSDIVVPGLSARGGPIGEDYLFEIDSHTNDSLDISCVARGDGEVFGLAHGCLELDAGLVG